MLRVAASGRGLAGSLVTLEDARLAAGDAGQAGERGVREGCPEGLDGSAGDVLETACCTPDISRMCDALDVCDDVD